MAREVVIALAVVVPDDVPLAAAVGALVGTSLPTLPTSWVTRAALVTQSPARGRTHATTDHPATALTCDELESELDDDFGTRDLT